MINKVFKVIVPSIPGRHVIEMQNDHKILFVGYQCEKVCIWYQCDPGSGLIDKVIYIYETSEIIKKHKHLIYLGSVGIDDWCYVLHLYESSINR